jgi:putative membrane protein
VAWAREPDRTALDDAKGACGVTSTSLTAAPTSTTLAEQRTALADDRTKLAVLRTIVALDRTLMAWVRTATSLISFGFTIYKFFQALRESEATHEAHLMTPRGVGLVMIGLGVAGLLVATIEYRSEIRELRESFHQYGPFRRSPALAVAATISGLGVLGFILVFLRQ